MADIIIVYPRTGFELNDSTIEAPLSIISIASTLVDSYDVKIIDARIDEKWDDNLKNELKKEPLCVLVSSFTGTQIKHALEVSKITKDNSTAKTIWGGNHPTLFPEQTARHPLVDVAVIGNGEITIKDIADKLSKGLPLNEVKGIAFKDKDGKIIRTPPQDELELDSLPGMPYELFDMERYIKGRLMVHDGTKRALPFVASRGCPWRCSFCSQPAFSKRKWIAMSAKRTVEETDYLVEKFRLDTISFYDDNFLTDKLRAVEIAKLIGNRYKWGIQARMDDLGRVDLKSMVEGGFNFVQPGIESGSQRILDMIKKDVRIQTFMDTNKKLAAFDEITVVYNFMMGFPTETKDDLMMTADLALRLLKENRNARVAGFYTFTPYVGTELFNVALQHGFKPPENLEGWIDYSRHHNMTPWITNDGELRNIMYASKFLDMKRMGEFFNGNLLLKPIIGAYGRFNRLLWKRHVFGLRPDIALIDYVARRYLGW